MSEQPEPDQEILAITTVHAALKNLDPAAQSRVIEYVARKLGVTTSPSNSESNRGRDTTPVPPSHDSDEPAVEVSDSKADNESDGISPVAQKWMRRNKLSASQLSSTFSIGGDEIDLIANKVPGDSSKARMHNVFLLKGVAAYLAGGAPRFSHEQVKETCLHYDAYDVSNFASNLKKLAPDISGTKETGYVLTARGLANATELVQKMAGGVSG